MAKLKSSNLIQEAAKAKRKDHNKSVEQLAAERPSAFESELRAKLRDKVSFNLGPIPRFIEDIFYEQMEKEGLSNKKEFLYHLLRERGGDLYPL